MTANNYCTSYIYVSQTLADFANKDVMYNRFYTDGKQISMYDVHYDRMSLFQYMYSYIQRNGLRDNMIIPNIELSQLLDTREPFTYYKLLQLLKPHIRKNKYLCMNVIQCNNTFILYNYYNNVKQLLDNNEVDYMDMKCQQVCTHVCSKHSTQLHAHKRYLRDILNDVLIKDLIYIVVNYLLVPENCIHERIF